MARRKSYSELTFADDFMFCKILTTRPDLCKELLELILEIKIKKVEVVGSQKEIEPKYDGRGVRLDVYAEDDAGTVFDIEMQAAYKRNLPKRMRYYQGMIDMNLIERGDEFDKLKQSYIIFICTEKPFRDGSNLPVYIFSNICHQNKEMKLGDGALKIVVNAEGDRNGLSEELSSFLDFIQDKPAQSTFTREVDRAVKEAIEHKKWEVEYMTFAMLLKEERAEAKEEGRIEGRVEGRNNVLYELVSDGALPLDMAVKNYNKTAQEKITAETFKNNMARCGFKLPTE